MTTYATIPYGSSISYVIVGRIDERRTENVLATVLRETDLLVAADLDLLDERLDSVLYLLLLLCL